MAEKTLGISERCPHENSDKCTLFRYAVRRLPLDAFPAAAREHPPQETPPPPCFDELEPPPSYEEAVGLGR